MRKGDCYLIDIGSAVQIFGLSKSVHYNGQFGTVESSDDREGKIEVRLQNGKGLRVKRENLLLVNSKFENLKTDHEYNRNESEVLSDSKLENQTPDAASILIERALDEAYAMLFKCNLDPAIKRFESALLLSTELNDSKSTSSSYRGMGLVFESLGKYDRALKMYNQLLGIDIALDDDSATGNSYSSLGRTSLQTGQHALAVNFYSNAVKHFQQTGNSAGQGEAYLCLGKAYEMQEHFDLAHMTIIKSQKIFGMLGDNSKLAQSFSQLGRIHVSIGHSTCQYSTAIDMYTKSMELYRILGDELGLHKQFVRVATTFELQNNFDTAARMCRNALQISCRLGDIAGQAEDYAHLGKLYGELGKYDQAIKMLDKSLEISRANGDKIREAQSCVNFASVYTMTKEISRALDMCMQALKIFQQLGDEPEVAKSYKATGVLYEEQANFAMALEMDEKSLERFQLLNDEAGVGDACEKVGNVLLALGRTREADEMQERSTEINCRLAEIAFEVYTKTIGQAEKLGLMSGSDFFSSALASQPKSSPRIDTVESANLKIVLNQTLSEGHALLQQYNFHGAAKSFEMALDTAEQLGDLRVKGSALQGLGIAFESLGHFDRALEMHTQSLAIDEVLGDECGMAASYDSLGDLYHAMGRHELAVEAHTKSLELSKRLQDSTGLAKSYLALGTTYAARGQYQLALEMCRTALDIFHALSDVEAETACRCTMGHIYTELGEQNKALEMLSKSDECSQQSLDAEGQAKSKHGLGRMHTSLGNYGQALDMLHGSLETAVRLGDQAEIWQLNCGLGEVYSSLGQYDKALDCYNQALKITHCLGKIAGEATCYSGIGTVYSLLHQYGHALDMHQHALEINIMHGFVAAQAVSYQCLGNISVKQKQYDIALEQFSLAMKAAKNVGSKVLECTSEQGLGIAYFLLQEYERAYESMDRSLQLAVRHKDAVTEFGCNHNMGMVKAKERQFQEAVRHFEAGLLCCEAIQLNLEGRDAERISLFEEQRRCYINLQMALLDLGRSTDALLVSERGKARALNHLLWRNFGKNIDASTDVVTSWEDLKRMIECESSCLLEFSILEKNTLCFWLTSPDGTLKACNQVDILQHLSDVGGSLAALLEITRCAIGAEGRDFTCAGAADRAYITKEQEQWLLRTCKVRQRMDQVGIIRGEITPLDDKETTAILDIFGDALRYQNAVDILQQHSEVCAWLDEVASCEPRAGQLRSREPLASHPSARPGPIKHASLLSCVEAVKAHATNWKELQKLTEEDLTNKCGVDCQDTRAYLLATIQNLFDQDRLLRKLHTLLVAQVQEDLKQYDSVLIVPDLDLFGVPWCALKDGCGTFLVESHTVRLAPSLVTARRAASPPLPSTRPRVAAVGNPWPVGLQGLESLSAAMLEATAVAVLFNARPLLESHATKAAVEQLLQGADVVHLACHGWLDRQSLLLAPSAQGDDGLLTSEDIQTRIRLARGSTVVLSACNSGRGMVKGEGVVGLSRAFFAAGAGSVVVSLWSIPDCGTKQLMSALYFALGQGCDLPLALRFAMTTMLLDGGPYSTPLSWAGFVVLGARTVVATLPQRGVAEWSVLEVCALFKRCGLDSALVADNGVNGAVLSQLTDEEMAEHLGLTQEQIACLRREQAAAGPPATRVERSLTELRSAFRAANPGWFEALRAAGGGRGDRDRDTAAAQLA